MPIVVRHSPPAQFQAMLEYMAGFGQGNRQARAQQNLVDYQHASNMWGGIGDAFGGAVTRQLDIQRQNDLMQQQHQNQLSQIGARGDAYAQRQSTADQARLHRQLSGELYETTGMTAEGLAGLAGQYQPGQLQYDQRQMASGTVGVAGSGMMGPTTEAGAAANQQGGVIAPAVDPLLFPEWKEARDQFRKYAKAKAVIDTSNRPWEEKQQMLARLAMPMAEAAQILQRHKPPPPPTAAEAWEASVVPFPGGGYAFRQPDGNWEVRAADAKGMSTTFDGKPVHIGDWRDFGEEIGPMQWTGAGKWEPMGGGGGSGSRRSGSGGGSDKLPAFMDEDKIFKAAYDQSLAMKRTKAAKAFADSGGEGDFDPDSIAIDSEADFTDIRKRVLNMTRLGIHINDTMKGRIPEAKQAHYVHRFHNLANRFERGEEGVAEELVKLKQELFRDIPDPDMLDVILDPALKARIKMAEDAVAAGRAVNPTPPDVYQFGAERVNDPVTGQLFDMGLEQGVFPDATAGVAQPQPASPSGRPWGGVEGSWEAPGDAEGPKGMPTNFNLGGPGEPYQRGFELEEGSLTHELLGPRDDSGYLIPGETRILAGDREEARSRAAEARKRAFDLAQSRKKKPAPKPRKKGLFSKPDEAVHRRDISDEMYRKDREQGAPIYHDQLFRPFTLYEIGRRQAPGVASGNDPKDIPIPTPEALYPDSTYDPNMHVVEIQNENGTMSSEITITVESADLNGGRPTVIPTLINGEKLSDDDAVKWAIESGLEFRSFKTISEADSYARWRSKQGGATALGFLGKKPRR